MIENFRDKNFVIATFFHDYQVLCRSTRVDDSRSHSTHNCTWLGVGLVRCTNMKRKKLDKTFFLPLVPSAVVCLTIPSTCIWIRYKTKEVVWTEVLADLVGYFCSFSESRRTESVLLHCWHYSTFAKTLLSPSLQSHPQMIIMVRHRLDLGLTRLNWHGLTHGKDVAAISSPYNAVSGASAHVLLRAKCEPLKSSLRIIPYGG